MKEKYPIKGSNTLYKVWGIIVFVFAAIKGLVLLFFAVFQLVVSGVVLDFIGKIVGPYIAIGMIFSVLFVGISMAKEISTGIILVREYIKVKWVFIMLAVIYFLDAVGLFVIMILSAIAGVMWLVLLLLPAVVWSVATGIILISKSEKADFTPPEPVPEPNPSVYGVIEGIYGNFKGKQVTLYPGGVCRIGRESGCDIQLVHPKVSRVHCMISMTANGRYQITDYSYNGTFYDNERLTKNIMVEVNPGGMLVIGEADNVLKLK
ncbi:hypothetical protein C818_01964 [Lachnospiraceae bacterium MD308]|nr:hypothetical protein C818_01964 [Lachnospiraceae bacterium MD308]